MKEFILGVKNCYFMQAECCTYLNMQRNCHEIVWEQNFFFNDFSRKKMLKIFWKKGSIIAPNKINSFVTCKTSTLSYSSMTMIKTSATHTAIILTDWPFKHSPSKQMSCIYLSFSFLVKGILVPCEDYKFSHFPYWYWCAVFFCLLMPFCLHWIFTSSLSDFNELFLSI